MSYADNLNTYLNPTPETIVRKASLGNTGYEEAPASGSLTAPYPGMLLQFNSDGTVSVQTAVGGGVVRAFAIEDALQGKTIDDQYSQNNVVRYVIAKPGDVLRCVIPAGVSTSIGTMLQSYGDGSLAPVASSGGGVLYASNANSNVVTNTTSQTAFSNGSYVVPPHGLAVGDVLHFVASGKINNVVTNDTVTVRLLMGTTVVETSGAVAPAANDTFYIDATLVVRTVGASGTVVVGGVQGVGTPGTVTAKEFFLGETAVNTNANVNFAVTAQWNAAATNDNIQLNILSIERFRVSPTGALGMAQEAVNNANGTGYEFVDVLIF